MKKSSLFSEILNSAKIMPALIVIISVFFLFSCIYTVKESEVGLLRTLGKVTQISNPGIHLKLPFPIQEIDVINVSKANTLEIGIKDIQKQKMIPSDNEGILLTKDENIVLVDTIVEWKVTDPKAYLFSAQEPEQMFKDAAIASLRAAIGGATIDNVLTDDKADIENKTKENLEESIQKYNLGIQVLGVKIQDAQPPIQVQKSFEAVTDAREQKNTLINKAEDNKAQKLTTAQGEAEKIIKEAEAYAGERVNKAKAGAAKFNSLYNQYKISKDVTKTRLLLEVLEEVLPGSNIYIVDKSGNTLNYLPSNELGGEQNE